MCGTTFIEFGCGHDEVQAVPAALCAIAYTEGPKPNVRDRLFCWMAGGKYPQGIRQVEGLCPSCQFRMDNYGTTDPVAVSTLGVCKAASDIRARSESSKSISSASKPPQPASK